MDLLTAKHYLSAVLQFRHLSERKIYDSDLIMKKRGPGTFSSGASLAVFYYFPSWKLVKLPASIAGAPYFSRPSAMALMRNAMLRARLRMV